MTKASELVVPTNGRGTLLVPYILRHFSFHAIARAMAVEGIPLNQAIALMSYGWGQYNPLTVRRSYDDALNGVLDYPDLSSAQINWLRREAAKAAKSGR